MPRLTLVQASELRRSASTSFFSAHDFEGSGKVSSVIWPSFNAFSRRR